VVVVCGLAYVAYSQSTQGSENNPNEATAVAEDSSDYLATESFGGTQTPAVTSKTEVVNTDEAKAVANNFMNARLERDYIGAQPFMTQNLIENLNQDKFAGTSSPSMDRFEITSIQETSKAPTYEATVKTYWLLSGDDAGTVIYTISVKKDGEKYLVDQFTEKTTDWK